MSSPCSPPPPPPSSGPLTPSDDADLLEMFDFFQYSYLPSTGYRGSLYFELEYPQQTGEAQSSPSSPAVVAHRIVRVSPDSGVAIESEPSKDYTAKLSMTRDTFFQIYMKHISPQRALWAGTMRVEGGVFSLQAVNAFVSAFENTEEKWAKFYKEKPIPDENTRISSYQKILIEKGVLPKPIPVQKKKEFFSPDWLGHYPKENLLATEKSIDPATFHPSLQQFHHLFHSSSPHIFPSSNVLRIFQDSAMATRNSSDPQALEAIKQISSLTHKTQRNLRDFMESLENCEEDYPYSRFHPMFSHQFPTNWKFSAAHKIPSNSKILQAEKTFQSIGTQTNYLPFTIPNENHGFPQAGVSSPPPFSSSSRFLTRVGNFRFPARMENYLHSLRNFDSCYLYEF